MIKIIAPIIIASSIFLMTKLNAQTLSPSVLPSAGGYFVASNASLSWTLGETVTTTLTSGSSMLTQGFQQPFQLNLNLNAFIEGYYLSAGLMENVLFNQGVTGISGVECDSIQVELKQSSAPYTTLFSTTTLLKTNGQITLTGLSQLGQTCYIVIKGRNIVETWSANPIQLNENTVYDFTTAANKAFGNNMQLVEPNVWAIYSGDLNADENVDLLDLSNLEADINAFQFGYFATDINGDGNVDLLDVPTVEENINNFVFSIHP